MITDIYFDDEFTGDAVGQDAPGVPGTAEAGDQYGRSLDTIRVGGTSRLAVGAPGEDVGSAKNAGLVQLFSWDGADPVAGTALTQDTAGVADSAQSGDVFGEKGRRPRPVRAMRRPDWRSAPPRRTSAAARRPAWSRCSG